MRTNKGVRSGHDLRIARNYLEQQADTVLERAPVLIGAVISKGRKGLRDQIPMRRVNLYHAKSRFEGAAGGFHKCPDDGLNSLLGQGPRHQIVTSEGNRAGGNYILPAAHFFRHGSFPVPWTIGAGLPPGMCQLHPGDAALGVNEPGNAGEKLDMVVAPNSEIFGTDPAFRCYGGGFRHHQSRAPNGPASQVDQDASHWQIRWYWNIHTSVKRRCDWEESGLGSKVDRTD